MENGDDADDTAYIYTSDNSDWITVFSDVLEIGDEQTFAEILHPFFENFEHRRACRCLC